MFIKFGELMKKIFFLFAIVVACFLNLKADFVERKTNRIISENITKSTENILYSWNFDQETEGWTINGTSAGFQHGVKASFTWVGSTGNQTKCLWAETPDWGGVADIAISPELNLAEYAERKINFSFDYYFTDSFGEDSLRIAYRILPSAEWVYLTEGTIPQTNEGETFIYKHFNIFLPEAALVDGVQLGLDYDGAEGGLACAFDNPALEDYSDFAGPELLSTKGNKGVVNDSLYLAYRFSDFSMLPETLEATYSAGAENGTIMLILKEVNGAEYLYKGSLQYLNAESGKLDFSIKDESGNETVVSTELIWSQPLTRLEDNFENYEDFKQDFGDYEQIDIDQRPVYYIGSTEYENLGEAGSFQVFNPRTTIPSVEGNVLTGHSGAKFLACFDAVPVPNNNDWLITPVINITQNNIFSFWARSATIAYGAERIRVAVSTKGSDQSDFNQVISTTYHTAGKDYIEVPDDWTRYEFDLSAYSGQNIRVGINCISDDAFLLMLDDLALSNDTTTPQVTSMTGLSVGENEQMTATITIDDNTTINSGKGWVTQKYSSQAGTDSVTVFDFNISKSAKGETVMTANIPKAGSGYALGSIKVSIVDEAFNELSLTYDVNWGSDNIIPELKSVDNTTAFLGRRMPVTIEVFDHSEIIEVKGIYQVGNTEGEVLFDEVDLEAKTIEGEDLPKLKNVYDGIRTFKGYLPAQERPITGSIFFEITDLELNTLTSSDYQVEWNTNTGEWFSYGDDWNSALSLDGRSAYQIAVDYEIPLKSETYARSLITATVDSLNLNWKIVDFTTGEFGDALPGLSGSLESSGEFGEQFIIDETTIRSNTPLPERFALVLDIPEYLGALNNGVATDDNTPVAGENMHLWINTDIEVGNWNTLFNLNIPIKAWCLNLKADGIALGDKSVTLLPGKAKLYQNYPNPFNPTTTIKFYANYDMTAQLNIYNLKGQLVTNVFKGNLKAGVHDFNFTAENLTSGLYFYKMITPEKIFSGKMILCK